MDDPSTQSLHESRDNGIATTGKATWFLQQLAAQLKPTHQVLSSLISRAKLLFSDHVARFAAVHHPTSFDGLQIRSYTNAATVSGFNGWYGLCFLTLTSSLDLLSCGEIVKLTSISRVQYGRLARR